MHRLFIPPLVQNGAKTECVFTSSTNASDAAVLKFAALAVTRFYVPTLCGKQDSNTLKNTHLNITASTMFGAVFDSWFLLFLTSDTPAPYFVQRLTCCHRQVSSSNNDCEEFIYSNFILHFYLIGPLLTTLCSSAHRLFLCFRPPFLASFFYYDSTLFSVDGQIYTFQKARKQK